MNKFTLFIVVVIIVFSIDLTYAQKGWEMTTLYTQAGYSLFVSDTTLYAATDFGVYFTKDGFPWEWKGPSDFQGQPKYYIYDIFKSNKNLLAASLNGIIKCTDTGINWQSTSSSPIFIGSGAGISGSHLFAKNSSYIFVIARNKGIFRSGDDGNSWQQLIVGTDPQNSQDYAASATSIYAIGEKIIINCSGTLKLFSSTNNGNTWNGSNPQFQGGLCFYYSGGKLFAGGPSGVYLSTDEGTTWTTQYSNTSGIKDFRDLIYYEGNLVAAVGDSSIQISRDDGKSWKSFNQGLNNNWVFASMAIKPPYIWALRATTETTTIKAYRRLLSEIVTDVENGDILPSGFSLSQNYPNPFNPVTTINYSIQKTGYVTLKIFDMLGREVSSLVNVNKYPGNYSIQFNASKLSSGIYFYQLKSGNFTATKKFILLK